MFAFKKGICLIFLIAICYEVNGQIEEVAVWELVKAIGQGIFYLFRGIKEGKSFIDNMNSPAELNSTYRYMMLQTTIQQIEDKLENLSNEVSDLDLIKNSIFSIKESTIEMDNIYNHYAYYLNRNESSYNLLLFAEAIINVDVGIPHKILKIHSNFVGEDKYNLALLIEKYIDVLVPFCSAQQSRQQYFYELFISIMSYEFKAYVLLDYAYNITSKIKEIDQESEKNFVRINFKERIDKTVSLFNGILKRSSRDLWKCDPNNHIKGKTYEELNLFRYIFFNEPDLFGDDAECTYTCSVPKNGITPPCQKENSCYLREQRRCNKVVDCYSIYKHDLYSVCLPHNQTSGHRYSKVDKTSILFSVFARSNSTCDGTYKVMLKNVKRKIIFPLECEPCICICDEGDDADRYVSLEMATSDIKRNYIVTGAKLVLKKHVLYLQVQQGKLLKGGFVSENSVQWKNYSNDNGNTNKFNLRWWAKRTINFNDMTLSKYEVVTGLRFIFDSNGYLTLDMRSTPFDVKSGKLITEKSYWYTTVNPDPKRSYLDLKTSDAPALSKHKNQPGSVRKQYVEFGPTGLKTDDAGQSTIPYIDTQDVITSPAMPLSGISLDIKKEDETGGFIMLRLDTYNAMWFK